MLLCLLDSKILEHSALESLIRILETLLVLFLFIFFFFLPINRLLDPANALQFDDFKKYYGEILHRWGLKEKRSEVLKFVSCPPEPHNGIGEYQKHGVGNL